MTNLPRLVDMDKPMVDGEFVRVEAPHRIVDGSIRFSTEHNVFTGDYYREFGIEFDSELLAWAEEHNGHFEWVNPAEFQFVKN